MKIAKAKTMWISSLNSCTSLSASSITPCAASHHAQRGGGWNRMHSLRSQPAILEARGFPALIRPGKAFSAPVRDGADTARGKGLFRAVAENILCRPGDIRYTVNSKLFHETASKEIDAHGANPQPPRPAVDCRAIAPDSGGNAMKTVIAEELDAFIDKYCATRGIARIWQQPIVRYADARHPAFAKLKTVAFADHAMPEDFLEQPRAVVSYFLPFIRDIAESNVSNQATSAVWAEAYLVTNRMAADANLGIAETVRRLGHRAAPPENIGFDPIILKSRWSQRHVAWIAGHGSFGLNNMLIGEKGCCGRYFSVITSLPVATDLPVAEEYCLYRKKGVCKVCVKRCFSGALTETGFDRTRCFAVCRENERTYKDAEVCGKCVVGLPCTFRRP